MSANTPEPAPQLGEGVSSTELVIADFKERRLMGQKKYGVDHQWDNGRDHLVDLYQELQDATVYVRAEIEKRKVLRNEVLEEVARAFELNVEITSVGQGYTQQFVARVRRMKQEPVAVRPAGVWVPGALSAKQQCRICGSFEPVNRDTRCLACFSKL